MTTFLNLCKSLAQECSIAGSPTSVESQTGELKQVVDWIVQSYIEIQNRGQWRWLKREFQLSTVAGTDRYAFSSATDAGNPIDRFTAWYVHDLEDPARIYKTSDGVGGETYLHWLELEWFRGIHKIGTQNNQRPLHVTVDNQDNLLLGPKPDDVYTVTGWYWRGPQVLAEDGEVPEMPLQYHQLIVYHAMEHYAFKYVAQEHLEHARTLGRRMLRNLEKTQGPKINLAGPMA